MRLRRRTTRVIDAFTEISLNTDDDGNLGYGIGMIVEQEHIEVESIKHWLHRLVTLDKQNNARRGK